MNSFRSHSMQKSTQNREPFIRDWKSPNTCIEFSREIRPASATIGLLELAGFVLV